MVTLEAIPLFRQLNRIELQALRLIAQERQFAAGQEIFHEGAPGDGVYFIKAGLVEISAGTGVARRVFSQLGPGEIFGEMAIIEHRPRSASASAGPDTEVYFLPRLKERWRTQTRRLPRLHPRIDRRSPFRSGTKLRADRNGKCPARRRRAV